MASIKLGRDGFLTQDPRKNTASLPLSPPADHLCFLLRREVKRQRIWLSKADGEKKVRVEVRLCGGGEPGGARGGGRHKFTAF